MKIIFQIVANVPAYIGGKAVEELIWFFLFKCVTPKKQQLNNLKPAWMSMILSPPRAVP